MTTPLSRLTLLLLTLSLPLAAETLVSRGMAPLDAAPSLEAARNLAIQDALEQAALDAGAVISAQTSGAKPEQDRLSVSPEQRPSQYRIRREWQEGGMLMVEVEADFIEPGAKNLPSSVSSVSSASATPQGTSCPGGKPRYRKTVAATQFQIMQPAQAGDLDNPGQGVPNDILRRLEVSGGLLPTVNARAGVFRPPVPETQWQADPDAIRQVALTTDSQFVIAGRIMDAGVSAHATRAYWGWDSSNEGGQRFGVELPGTTLGAGVAQVATKRRFEVEWQVYDGATATLLARNRVGQEAAGKVDMSSQQPFGSAGFFSSDYGHTIDNVLGSTAHAIEDSLSCLPLTARIVKVEGQRIHFNAGGLQQLRPGDRLTVYRKQTNRPLSLPETNQPLGIPENPLALATVTQVQPRFSVATIDRAVPVKTGDWVRDDRRKTGDVAGHDATAPAGESNSGGKDASTANDTAASAAAGASTKKTGAKTGAKAKPTKANAKKKSTTKPKCDCPPTPTPSSSGAKLS